MSIFMVTMLMSQKQSSPRKVKKEVAPVGPDVVPREKIPPIRLKSSRVDRAFRRVAMARVIEPTAWPRTECTTHLPRSSHEVGRAFRRATVAHKIEPSPRRHRSKPTRP